MAKFPKKDTQQDDTEQDDFQGDSLDSIVFKKVMKDKFTELGVEVRTNVEVRSMPDTIDDVLVELDSESNLAEADVESKLVCVDAKLATVFGHAGPHNLIEYKSENDPLTIFEVYRILGLAHLYLAEKDVRTPDLKITIVCAKAPREMFDDPRTGIEFKSLGGGYYHNAHYPTIHIVAINELEVTSKNYPLLMGATSKLQFTAFLRNAIS